MATVITQEGNHIVLDGCKVYRVGTDYSYYLPQKASRSFTLGVRGNNKET